jgi:uncharacterized protein YdaU (DUF1376 family)
MKSPSFQLYASDLLIDTIEWDINEVGIYTRLLMAQWSNGDLPDDVDRLARIAGCSPKRLQKAWVTVRVKFTQNGEGRLINLRLEETRKKQEEYRVNSIESGRRGGLKTQQKKSIKMVIPSSDPPSDPSSDPSSENKALQSSVSITKISSTLFTIPMVDLVSSYCQERKNKIDPQRFIDHYTSNGWMVGKNKMRDWKAAVRTWEKNQGGNGNGSGHRSSPGSAFTKTGRAESDGQPYPADREY